MFVQVSTQIRRVVFYRASIARAVPFSGQGIIIIGRGGWFDQRLPRRLADNNNMYSVTLPSLLLKTLCSVSYLLRYINKFIVRHAIIQSRLTQQNTK